MWTFQLRKFTDWGSKGVNVLSAENLFFKPGVDQNIALRASPAESNSAVLTAVLPVHSTSFPPILFNYKVTTMCRDSGSDSVYLRFDGVRFGLN